jgi:hypothetical protein
MLKLLVLLLGLSVANAGPAVTLSNAHLGYLSPSNLWGFRQAGYQIRCSCFGCALAGTQTKSRLSFAFATLPACSFFWTSSTGRYRPNTQRQKSL